MWEPPPPLTVSEWADEHFQLVGESSSTTGQWTTLPYQREPMDLITDSSVGMIVVMKSARVGFTKSMITAPIGYHVHHDPCSMLVVQPTVEDAEGFSKEEIAPMARETASVGDRIGAPRSRDSDNTILKKSYPGGILHMGGANSSRVFRRITVRKVWLDEIDAYPVSAGNEGDPIYLAKQRAADAWNRQVIVGSSPGLKGVSKIEPLFEQSDQRRFFVPCPHCDHGQTLKWGGRDHDYGIKFEPDDPAGATYLCEHCHAVIEYHQQRWMVDQGHYEAQNKKGLYPGFHIWAAYSPLPAAHWGVLAQDWLNALRDPISHQVFVNTVLGETWEQKGQSANEHKLASRRERYPERETGRTTPEGEPERIDMVPKGVAVITAAVDVQLDRLEVGVEGWGYGEENWKLEYHVLHGDPTATLVWEELWALLKRERHLERGGTDYIRSTCIDTGYAAQSVAGFVGTRPIYRTGDRRRAYLWAIKGMSGTGDLWPSKPSKSKHHGAPFYSIHVDAAKDQVSRRAEMVTTPGPKYIHFPIHFGDDYFMQLTAEHSMLEHDRKGFAKRIWQVKKGRRRNEAFDIAVYNYASLWALYRMLGLDLDSEALKTGAFKTAAAEVADEAGPVSDDDEQRAPAPKRKPKRRTKRGRSKYLGG